MKIFEGKRHEKDWGEKHNFIDENNVFVGFDSEQSCCEIADWFISDKIETIMPDPLPKEDVLDGWTFDQQFFEKRDFLKYSDMNANALDSGGMVIFRIVNNGEEKFLHLFNCHNGYYGHGFSMEIGGLKVMEGSL